MPVYNGAEYLREAIGSVFDQTFSDFELLIIDDGSIDDSALILSSINDSRVRLFKHSVNQGLIASLNKVLVLANGDYIIRMDCDDISLPERFEQQYRYMECNPEIGVCGSWIKTIGAKKGRILRRPTRHDEIKASLLFGSYMVHPSVIIRKSVIERHNLLFNDAYPHAEDYEFWVRMSEVTKLANLDKILLLYRIHSHQISIKYQAEQEESVKGIQESLFSSIGLQVSGSQMRLHRMTCREEAPGSEEEVSLIGRWLMEVGNAALNSRDYDSYALAKVLAQQWKSVCNTALSRGLSVMDIYRTSSIRNNYSSKVDFDLRLKARVRYLYVLLHHIKRLKRIVLAWVK